MDRRSHTTMAIRSAARAEFTQVGPRALNLHKVAARAYVSVGAVYERWPNSRTCIVDLVTQELPVTIANMREFWRDGSQQLDTLVYRNLFDSLLVDDLRFIAECVFAARDDASLQPIVRESVASFHMGVLARTRPANGMNELGWWVASTWLGYALLNPAGCSIPDSFVAMVARIVDEMGHVFAQPSVVAALTSESLEFLPERPVAKDSTTEALLDATRRLISERGISTADTRSIAQAAGVTTGALYRRFGGRTELLVTAFITALPAERYAWTQPLLAELQTHGLPGGGLLLAKLCERIWRDEAHAQALLEFTIAAHTDPGLRDAIFTEIRRVAEIRAALFKELQTAGIVRDDLSPEALGWLFQVPPVGMRLLASIDVIPDLPRLAELFEAFFNFLMASIPLPQATE